MRTASTHSTQSTLVTTGYHYKPGALDPLESAAARLGTSAEALQERCEREAERCGDVAVAYLDAGVVAFRAGGEWRLRFPEGEVVRAILVPPGAVR